MNEKNPTTIPTDLQVYKNLYIMPLTALFLECRGKRKKQGGGKMFQIKEWK